KRRLTASPCRSMTWPACRATRHTPIRRRNTHLSVVPRREKPDHVSQIRVEIVDGSRDRIALAPLGWTGSHLRVRGLLQPGATQGQLEAIEEKRIAWTDTS